MKEYGDDTLNKVFNAKTYEELKIIIAQINDINARYYNANTVLHVAIENSDKLVSHLLLDRTDIRVNLQNNDEYTPLHLAMKNNLLSTAHSLIYRGADISIKDKGNKTAFMYTSSQCDDEDKYLYARMFKRASNINNFWNTNSKCLAIQGFLISLNMLYPNFNKSYAFPMVSTLVCMGISHTMINSNGGINHLNTNSIWPIMLQLAGSGVNIWKGDPLIKASAIISIGLIVKNSVGFIPTGCG